MGGVRGRGQTHGVWDESEPVVDLDAAKEGLECTGNPMHTPFHGVHALARPGRLFSHLVEGLHLLLEQGEPLSMVLFEI